MSSTFLNCPNFSSPFRKQECTDYELCTLSGFQRSFQRHLHEKRTLLNILKDNEFSRSRDVLAKEKETVLNRGPGTSAQVEENQILASTSTQNVIIVQHIQPKTIFTGEHPKFEGCTFNCVNVFCGDQSAIIERLNKIIKS